MYYYFKESAILETCRDFFLNMPYGYAETVSLTVAEVSVISPFWFPSFAFIERTNIKMKTQLLPI